MERVFKASFVAVPAFIRVDPVSNSKLVDRSLRILRDLAGVERERGLTLLEEAGGSVKLALLMAAAALSVDQAKALLQQHNQQLRPALAACGAQLAEA